MIRSKDVAQLEKNILVSEGRQNVNAVDTLDFPPSIPFQYGYYFNNIQQQFGIYLHNQYDSQTNVPSALTHQKLKCYDKSNLQEVLPK